MAYKSRAQARFLNSQKPEVAEKMNKTTPKQDYKNLPDKVRKGKNQGGGKT